MILQKLIYSYYFLRDASIVYFRKLTKSKKRPNGKLFRTRISDIEGNDLVYKLLSSNEPFAVGRIGASETFNINEYFAVKFGYKKHMKERYRIQLHTLSGFFPPTEDNVKRFCDIFLESLKEIDVLPTYRSFMEEYIVREYAKKDVVLTEPHTYEPYFFENPWSRGLVGKKVLVVSPFADSIKEQYAGKQECIFKNPEVLPKFELNVVNAVQTIAGNKDDRFDDWFEALDYMYNECMKVDFDVALVGCGVYALPLSARIKKAGKQVIMMCGSTQYLFGIKSSRTDARPYMRELYTDAWIYPSEKEKPRNSSAVEGGCYWK